MNWQFFATAGIVSGILWVTALVCFLLADGGPFSWKTERVLSIINVICFLLPIAFWLVIGVVSGLSLIWGWGLVQ